MERGLTVRQLPASAPQQKMQIQPDKWLLIACREVKQLYTKHSRRPREAFVPGEHLDPKKRLHNLVYVLPIPKDSLEVRMAWTMHESTLTQGLSPLQASLG